MSERIALHCVTTRDELPSDCWVIAPCWKSNLSDCLAELASQWDLDPHQLTRIVEPAPEESIVVYPSEGRYSLQLLGLGQELDPAALRRRLTASLRKRLPRPAQVAVDLRYACQVVPGAMPELAAAAVEGIILGDYDPGDLHKSERSQAGRPEERGHLKSLHLVVPPDRQAAVADHARFAGEVAGAQREILDLINQPGNLMTPMQLAEAARRAGEREGFRVEVLEREAIQREGLQALLAVNQGSSAPPALIVLEHAPDQLSGTAPTVGLVGKGVTFDSGGLSLKGRENMSLMKFDMAGAAAVLGSVIAAARSALPLRVVGVIPATDNKPDGAALNPGDVILSRAGISIEVEDTDAEGRLILADGLAYLNQHYSPDVLIDLATLTGACIVALGNQAAGLFTANDQLAGALCQAGDRVGERLWRLPLWPEYDPQLESDIADVKNLGSGGGGAITAARFLSKFTESHPAWAHLDIAGVAFPETEGSRFRVASGFGVRLLAEYLRHLVQET